MCTAVSGGGPSSVGGTTAGVGGGFGFLFASEQFLQGLPAIGTRVPRQIAALQFALTQILFGNILRIRAKLLALARDMNFPGLVRHT